MSKSKKTVQSPAEEPSEKPRRILPEDMDHWVMPEPVDLCEADPVDEAEEYLRRAKEREQKRRESDLAKEREQAEQQEKIRQSNANLQNKNFTYDYNGAPIIIHNNKNNNIFPGLTYQVKHSIQDAKVTKPKQAPQMREITNVKKSVKPNVKSQVTNVKTPIKPSLDSEQEITQKHMIQASVPTYDLLEPQAGVTYIENGKVITSSKGRYESTFAQAGSLISTTFGANTRLSRNEYLQLTKSNSSLVGMSIRGRDFGTQPVLQQPQISPITPPNMSQIRNLPPLVSPGDKGIMNHQHVLSSLNHNSASTPVLDNTGYQGILPHSNKNLSRNPLDNTNNVPRVRPNSDQSQSNHGLKENTEMGTMSYGGSMNKGLVYFDSERVKSLLAVEEDLASQVANQNQNRSKHEMYQAMYNMNNFNPNNNNNISSKISPVDLHNTNIINSNEWGKATYSMTGNSSLPVLPSRKPQIGGGQNTLGGKNMRHRVNAAGTGNGYAELLHSTIRNQQIV